MKNAAANLVLFAPLGWLLGIAVTSAPRRHRLLLGLAAITAAGLLSLGLEALQLFLPSRLTGLNDVVTNTAGTALGLAFALAWRR